MTFQVLRKQARATATLEQSSGLNNNYER